MITNATVPRLSARHWLRWLLGAALVAVVIVASLHWSEARDIALIAERVKPAWLLVAVGLQAGTYLAQSTIWRSLAHRLHFELPRAAAFRLSLAKLFIDQALPTAGFSGAFAVAGALQAKGMSRSGVLAGLSINTSGYFLAYALCLAVALPLVPLRGAAEHLVWIPAGVFIALSLLMTGALILLPGRHVPGWIARLSRYRTLERALHWIRDAEGALSRDRRLLGIATATQTAIVLLDAATLWSLIEGLGAHASPATTFGSFMIANLFRTIGVLPGGLGTFEASAVLTLQASGVPLPVGLAATLLFRGLSFWLPMLPGGWCARQLMRSHRVAARTPVGAYWAKPLPTLLLELRTSDRGLSSAAATSLQAMVGRNELVAREQVTARVILLRQLSSPLLLLLVFAAVVAAVTGQWADALIVLTIVLVSAVIGFRREYSAHRAAELLRARIRTRTCTVRDGCEQTLPVEEVVPGDIVLLNAGSLVPADARILDATDCYVSEAGLTGESFPVRKMPGDLPEATPLARRTNCLHQGTNVRSGTVRAVVVATGEATQYGAIAERLRLRPPETDFDRSMRRFGYLLTSAMLVIVLVVFAAHMLAGRPVIETLLFSVALAVGLSPELLPAILSVNLARGAATLADGGVLVRRLSAIENLGSMDVLCTDKTGTLTEGVVKLHSAVDVNGAASDAVLELAALNAALETGLASPLDDAIVASRTADLTSVRKLAEVPFDFVRKRVSIVIERGERIELIVKGAHAHVLEACVQLGDGRSFTEEDRQVMEDRVAAWSRDGLRVLAVAHRELPRKNHYDRTDESALRFAGWLLFLDRPKEGAAEAIAALKALGVNVKVITGDARAVAEHVARLVGIAPDRTLTGLQLDELHDDALWREAERTQLFVEVDPNQKERIILALKKTGHVVGFLGDGVNDAPAMHAADTSLSVEQAVDVAREAADFVLLERNLDAIRRGIVEGRTTFANTLKYVLTTTSANLGNMLSMAVASLFLPFLPLLAGQILLNNFLSDIPALGIANDAVDREQIEQPRHWDMQFIGRYMVEFGALSSLFDVLTFALLLAVFHATPELFRSGWFVESLLTELVIALVIRTRRPFYLSRPGNLLLGSTLLLIPITLAIPYLPYANVLGFVPLPATLSAALLGITAMYIVATEVLKRWFYRSERPS